MSHLLAESVAELTRPHLRRSTNDTGEAVYGQEEALLHTLKSLITPSGSTNGNSDGGGSGSKSRPLINLDALALWQDIEKVVGRSWPHAGNPAYIRVPLPNKLAAWHANTADPVEAVRLYEHCAKWVDRIREALEPSRRMPLKGACPECDKTHVETLDEEGSARYDTAIVAYPDAAPVYAACQVCDAVWEGSALHELGAKLV